MPHAAIRKVSFNGGVVSPFLDGRIDLARYQTGCVESKNQIPCDWGGSATRPGLIYDDRPDRPSVLIPYVVSSNVAYFLMFSALELRIVKRADSGDSLEIIQDGGDDIVIVTPYTEDDLYELQVDSLVDLLWVWHPNHPTYRLTRESETEWTFGETPYLNPPMIPRAGEEAKLTPVYLAGDPGVLVDYYHIAAITDPDNLVPLTPVATEAANHIFWPAPGYAKPDARTQNWGNIFRAIIDVDVTGDHDFELFADDYAKLYIDGVLVASELTIGGGTATGTATLTAGEHDLEVRFTQGSVDVANAGVTLAITPPGEAKQDMNAVSGAGWALFKPDEQIIELTSDVDLFEAGHVGSYWRLGHELATNAEELSLGANGSSGWITVSGDWSFTTSGNWRGRIQIERREIGEVDTEVIRDFKAGSELRNVATTGNESPPAELRIVFSDWVGAGAAYNPHAVIEVSNNKIYGLVRITSYTDEQTVTAEVISPLYDTVETDLWEEGAWSAVRGYPATGAVYERRLMAAATNAFPNRYWASRQDDREDFELVDETQSALAFDLPSRDVISWMLADQQLLVGTRQEEVIVSSGRDDLPLSPENSVARTSGNIGSSRVPPVRSSNAILYAERRGRRIRELSNDPTLEGFANTDLTAFAPHLLNAPVLQMASAQLHQRLVFVLLSNRVLLCINHDRDQQMGAWFVIETEGDFESVASIPGDHKEDLVAVITRRTIDGEEVRQLEHFAIDQWDLLESDTPADMVFSDMAKSYDFGETATSTLTGLDDWEGLELNILGDGAVQPRKTVSGGEVTLTHAAKKVVVGIPYSRVMTPLWFEDVESASQGRRRKVAKVYFSTYQSGNITLQATDEDVFGTLEEGQQLLAQEIARRVMADPLGSAPGLENSYFEVSLESRHSRRQSVRFSSDSPLPMVIQSLHAVYDVGEK